MANRRFFFSSRDAFGESRVEIENISRQNSMIKLKLCPIAVDGLPKILLIIPYITDYAVITSKAQQKNYIHLLSHLNVCNNSNNNAHLQSLNDFHYHQNGIFIVDDCK